MFPKGANGDKFECPNPGNREPKALRLDFWGALPSVLMDAFDNNSTRESDMTNKSNETDVTPENIVYLGDTPTKPGMKPEGRTRGPSKAYEAPEFNRSGLEVSKTVDRANRMPAPQNMASMLDHFDSFLGSIITEEARLETEYNLRDMPARELLPLIRARLNVHLGEILVARQRYVKEAPDAPETRLDKDVVFASHELQYFRRDFDGPEFDF